MRWLPSYSACQKSIQSCQKSIQQHFLSRFRRSVNFNLIALFLPFTDTYCKTSWLMSASLSDCMMLVSELSRTFLLSAHLNWTFSLVNIFMFAVSFWFCAFAFSLFNRLFFKAIEQFLYFIWSINFLPSVPFS